MSKVMKIIGKIVRILLAAGAQNWKDAPRIEVRTLASIPGSDLPPPNGTVIASAMPDSGTVTAAPGPVVVRSDAPSVVVSAVQGRPYSWKTSLLKGAKAIYLVAAAATITLIFDPSFWRQIGLSETTVALILGILVALQNAVKQREQRQEQHQEQRRAQPSRG